MFWRVHFLFKDAAFIAEPYAIASAVRTPYPLRAPITLVGSSCAKWIFIMRSRFARVARSWQHGASRCTGSMRLLTRYAARPGSTLYRALLLLFFSLHSLGSTFRSSVSAASLRLVQRKRRAPAPTAVYGFAYSAQQAGGWWLTPTSPSVSAAMRSATPPRHQRSA